jgi:hypothetical protein
LGKLLIGNLPNYPADTIFILPFAANEECRDSQACINYACVDACIGKCGSNAHCEPRNHLAVCTCPDGTKGDAKVSCRTSRTFPVARYSRSLMKLFNETIADIEEEKLPQEQAAEVEA